jgi:DNA helicase-2/ATP-dependent DNA helicase PcrA
MGHVAAMRQPDFMAPRRDEGVDFVMDYDIGDLVASLQFGKGEIVDIDGMAVSVKFENGMTKKLNVEYARLEKL